MSVKSIFLSIFLLPTICLADDCLVYKIMPNVVVNTPEWKKQVVQPLQPMDVLHGNVIATMVDNYEITSDITPIEDGYCVSLKNIEATIGYSDFLVQVDISHKPDTCSYNAILDHEDEHIRAYLSIIEENNLLIRESIAYSANSINPIFVEKQEDIDKTIDMFNEQLQKHPDLILLKQHLKAEEEIKNKHVDQNNMNNTLKKCFE
ncbi:MAG: hypothetical protein MJ156_00045 [Alphaproteobacteria bacterium]|nr:hypothetical protein [Alphaproteobacteria bacterium]